MRTPGPGPDLIIILDPLTTDPCDHRFESRGHDPGPRLRHLSQVRHKQHPRWKVDQLPDGTFRWTTPAGRTYDTEPTRYPI